MLSKRMNQSRAAAYQVAAWIIAGEVFEWVSRHINPSDLSAHALRPTLLT